MQKAIILAAGIGKRLNNLTKNIPKCLLPIDSGSVLLDYSLEALRETNIKEIIFVSGFAYEKLEKYIESKWNKRFSIKFIFNDKYNEYNNIYSAYLAKDLWDDETVLLNSDIIFNPGIIAGLKQRAQSLEAGAKASYLVVDSTKQIALEDMKVELDEYGHIKRINKNLKVESSFGEYIGIAYLRRLERIRFLESLEKNIEKKNFDLYYEDALDQILDIASVFPYSTGDMLWTEVDTVEDYKRAIEIAKKIKLSKEVLKT